MKVLTFIYMHARSDSFCKIKTEVTIPDQPEEERSEIRGWKPNPSGTLT